MGIDRPADSFMDDWFSSQRSARADGAAAPSSMKWGSDGELSAVDLQGILLRLSAVDRQASTLMDCPLDS